MSRRIHTPTPHEEEIIRLEQQLRGNKVQIADLRKSVARARTEADLWQEKYDEALAIKEPQNIQPLLAPSSQHEERRGVSLVGLSDWHVAEKIDKAKVRGLNSYSPAICRKRAVHCMESVIRLQRHTVKSYDASAMVLWLGGDFVTGYLHPELEQTNFMGPVEESLFAVELLTQCIGMLAQEKSIKKLHIVCQRGNHGRTTKKMQFKNDFETSHETMVYAALAGSIKADHIHWEIPKADVHYVDLLKDWRLRCFHGHQVKYSDGVGGVSISLNKWQSKQDQTRKAHHNIMGHFHQYSEPNTRTTMNGSLKGWDEYAASFGFPYQEPLQTFLLLDASRRMVAQRMPVFCV